MKAPVNFAERVKGFRLASGFYNYHLDLGDSMGDNNRVWLYPQSDSPNVIMLEFDWKDHTYKICVARGGDGINFHTVNENNPFNPQYFRTFDLFIDWLRQKLADWWHYFGY
jgi:hypothetical protein